MGRNPQLKRVPSPRKSYREPIPTPFPKEKGYHKREEVCFALFLNAVGQDALL